MVGRSAIIGVACLAASLLASAAADAQALYRYIDRSGVIHFTNAPTDGRYQKVRGSRRGWRPPRSEAYDAVIEAAAQRNGLPPAIVKAVIAAESAFDARAVSPKGAMGLMQLMPQTASVLGVERPFEASQNVHGGARYLRELHDRFGSWTHALAAYNAGPTAVARYRGVPPYRETRQYVQRVLSYYRRYHDDFSR